MNEKIDTKKRIELLRYNKQLLFRWIRRNQERRPIGIFFQENRLEQVAFYYWNEMSDLLYHELKNMNIHVTGVVDAFVDDEIPVPVYSDVQALPDVDAIVICTAMNIAEIEEKLRMLTKCLIFTIDDLLQ